MLGLPVFEIDIQLVYHCNLKQYENIFDKFQTAFIPIASYL